MRRDPAQAIAVLDLLTEFFGEFGHRWISGMHEDRYGGRCLVSAVHHVSTEAQISGDDAEDYLFRALPAGAIDIDIYNDDCRSYDEIRSLILAARALAQAELDANRCLPLDLHLVSGAAK
jgi:hypothetical protein